MEPAEIPPFENLDLVKTILAHTDEATRLSIRLTADLFRQLGADDKKSPIISAIEQGYVELIPLLEELKYALPDKACRIAASHGQLEMLIYLKSRKSCQDSTMTLYQYAAYSGHLNIIQWLYTNTEYCYRYMVNVILQAIIRGHIQLLDWVRSINRYQFEGSHFGYLAAQNNQLEVLKWLVKHNSPPFHGPKRFDFSKPIEEAVAGGYVEILEWIQQHHTITITANAIDRCVKNDKLVILKWLRHHNLPWGQDKLSLAVINKKPAITNWLLKHGCARTSNDTLGAIISNNFEMFLLLVSYGCPYNYHECLLVAKPNIRQRLIEWRQS